MAPVVLTADEQCFNRPKAISCLATTYNGFYGRVVVEVSIARRRLVVLRRYDYAEAFAWLQSFNRPKAISCLATGKVSTDSYVRIVGFNRPKAISCLATHRRCRWFRWETEFQSPEGD